MLLGISALSLAPTWWLGERAPTGEWALAFKFGVPWVAALIGESALLGVAAQTLAEHPSRPFQMLVRALWKLPIMGAVIVLRVLAVGSVLGLGLLAADHAGEYASLLVVTAVIIAIAVSSTLSQASSIAFCGRGGPIRALLLSVELTRNLRFTVFKAKAKLVGILLLFSVAVDRIAELSPPLGVCGQYVLELLWFCTGAILTSVTFLVLRARRDRQRLEVAAGELVGELV